SYGAIYAIPWSSPACGIVGALTVWTHGLNTFLSLTVSISTYLR
ncbi:8583_t:CDS:1, partial [Ambispora leptoticha]